MEKSKGSLVSNSKRTTFSVKEETKILPTDLVNYLPWACLQLQFSFLVHVQKLVQISPSTTTLRQKIKNKVEISEGSEEFNAIYEAVKTENRVIKLNAMFEGDNCIQLIFPKHQHIPRELLALLGKIVCYQSNLTTLTFNNNINGESVYEIKKFLPLSYITDLCLDGCYIAQGNYHILLEEETFLRNLSLSRCSINDEIVKNIAQALSYFKPASKQLALLNLSSNDITDVGCQYIAEVLRMNRRLNYLNLASNLITDDGVSYILDILQEFPLTYDEILEKKSRRIDYLKKKLSMIANVINDLKVEEARKLVGSRSQTNKKEKDIQSKGKRTANVNINVEDKAEMIAIASIGEFTDPYSPQNVEVIDGYPYCKGNNHLCLLNLAYNNLSYFSVCKLVQVLDYQSIVKRNPRGLVNVIIEGNNIPPYCRELNKIDAILTMALWPSRLSRVAQVKRKV